MEVEREKRERERETERERESERERDQPANPLPPCLASPTLFRPACGLWLELESGIAGTALIR